MSNITYENYKLALNGYIGLVEVAVAQNKSGKHLDNIATLYNYGKQQQAKEECAKKEHDLLGLYQTLLKSETPLETVTIITKIRQLEEELKSGN